MCGIVVGLSFGTLNKRDEAMRQRLLRYFTTELLVRTEERGKDATGAAVLFDSGKYVGLKRGERAANFLGTFSESREYYGGFLKFWRESEENVRVYLGHCRAGTVGDKIDNENNHPIKIGNLVGIHNGKITNHDTIFKKLACKRDGKVDSESIFRLFDYYTKKGKEPFTLDMIQEVVKRLSGQYAISLFNADNPFQVPIFRDGRPVEFAFIRRYGILLIVSETKFWDEIHFRYERVVNYYREFHKVKFPGFLDKDDIEEKMLPDDSAAIFDLTTQVTSDTKIDDLCEWKKMARAKVWGAVTTTYGTSSNYNSTYDKNKSWKNRSTGVSSTDKDDKDSGKKRWVFDKIGKMYVAKQGDKELGDESSATLSTSEGAESKALVPVEKVSGNVGVDRKDAKDQSPSSAEIEMEDRADYTNQAPFTGGTAVYDDDITDIDPSDIEMMEAGGDVIEVEIEQYPPVIVEAAKKAYDDLKARGYGDWEELLTDVEIADQETAESLGYVGVANRAWKASWKNGFTNGALWAMEDKPKDKDDKREKHIVGLKSIILLLTRFFSIGCDEALAATSSDEFVVRQLREAVLESNRKVSIDEITKVFNTHERKQLAEVGKIISEAEQYKE